MPRSSGGGSWARSASSGRYVSKATAVRSPSRTVTERIGGSGGKGAHARSAITGRYVTGATAARWPAQTVVER